MSDLRDRFQCAARGCEGCSVCDPKATATDLRALLEKATPGPWAASFERVDDVRGRIIVDCVDADRDSHDAALIAALHNAAPDLLRVVEAVAEQDDPADDESCCAYCFSFGEHMAHCTWILARKLVEEKPR